LSALAILPESRQPSSEEAPERPHLDQMATHAHHAGIGLLVIVFFLSTLCFSCFEVTLALLVCDNFGLNIKDNATTATVATYLFVYCGLIAAFVQGGMIGSHREEVWRTQSHRLSLGMTAVSLALPPVHQRQRPALMGHPRSTGRPFLVGRCWGRWELLALGSSLTRPPLFGLLSNLTPPTNKAQTSGSLKARAAWRGSSVSSARRSSCWRFLTTPCSLAAQ